MAARGEDNLTQIQKYKALLGATRRKGGEEMAKKSKKKRKVKKEDDKTVVQPLLENNVVGSSSGLNMTEVKKNTNVHDKNDVQLMTKDTAMTGKR